MANSANGKTFDKQMYVALMVSTCASLFLFFIDEGYYNFNWMKNPADWFVFFVYVAILFLPQFILIFIFNKISNGRFKRIVPYLTGVLLGIVLAFIFFK